MNMRNEIKLLAPNTIDKIAAGEVVERPSSVVKELVENAIDAGSTEIAVEIKDGGRTLIRVTDNGCGIPAGEIKTAFLRHSTSKITDVSDLNGIATLGFRGEALSSIAAVSRTCLVTKTADALVASRFVIEGDREVSFDETGAPDGTTITVERLFYNTPARLKFLKTDKTEANYVEELIERLSLSHPSIRFVFTSNGAVRLQTSGNGKLEDVIYAIYGRDIYGACLPVSFSNEFVSISGFIGKPEMNRGNRLYENFFVNGRYVKNPVLGRAAEEGYVGFLMQHQYPFLCLFFEFTAGEVDVNVHPQKLEVRFGRERELYTAIVTMIHERLAGREDIAVARLGDDGASDIMDGSVGSSATVLGDEGGADGSATGATPYRETDDGFEQGTDANSSERGVSEQADLPFPDLRNHGSDTTGASDFTKASRDFTNAFTDALSAPVEQATQLTLNETTEFLKAENLPKFTYIGQVFGTYIIIEYDGKMYIIDQHAAHEKVLYERTMKALSEHTMTSQIVSPPIVVSLRAAEEDFLNAHLDAFTELGFEVEHFGGHDYQLTAVPANLFSIDVKTLFLDMLAECTELKTNVADTLVTERIASLSCKAAVKGNTRLSTPEIVSLIEELLTLDNPYHCPHGRPTIISMTRYELDKKFKRIV